MKKLTVLILLFISCKSIAQSSKKFILVDADTSKVIPFANILFNDEDYKGTSTDIDGVFYVPSHIKTVTISCVGYDTKILKIGDVKHRTLTLKQKISALDEVVLNAENPAHRIIRNAVANNYVNNPKNINSFTYKSYDKISITSGKRLKKNDSINKVMDSILKGSYFFITETIVKHKYLKPRFSEDSVIATKSSGFKNPNFALLANNFQPFSFYEEHITLFETDYLNPISKGSTRKYKFRLKDEYIKGKDTVFVISFEPKANRNFEGLKGLLYINSNKYAVQSVDASTFNSGKLDVTIQQKYNYIENKYWFPEQLNFVITIGEGFGSAKYVGKSYLLEITPNAPLKKKDFPFVLLTLPKNANLKDSTYWALNRRDTLNSNEKRTYTFIDSIGEKYKFDKLLKYSESLMQGKVPFKYVDLDLTKIAQYNRYEGLRLGLGLYTNNNLFKHVSIGGFAGYGLNDYKWKYGGELFVDVPSKKDILLYFKYENNLRGVGNFSRRSDQNPLNQRAFITNLMDAVKTYEFKTYMKLYRNINWSIGFNTTAISPLYDYSFTHNSTPITKYTNTELNLGFSYHVNEKLVNTFNKTTRLESDDPIFNLNYSKGLKNVFGGNFNYNKLQFTLDHSFKTKGLGKTSYRLDMGFIDTSLPYGQLFTGEGNFDRELSIIVKNYFQTVRPFEFLSDKYIHLFTTHNFGRLLNNKGYLQPDVLWHNNFGIANLSQSLNHQLIGFSTKKELFLETGLELKNILKLPVLDLGYLGLGIGGFYRYGYHHLENTNDNFALKYSIGFSFK